MGMTMNKEEWKCCDCSKSRAHQHEELWTFSTYGNNQHKKDDYIRGNERCVEHFLIAEKSYDEKFKKETHH